MRKADFTAAKDSDTVQRLLQALDVQRRSTRISLPLSAKQSIAQRLGAAHGGTVTVKATNRQLDWRGMLCRVSLG